MGQRDAFSSQDVQKINKMYKCPNTNGIEEEKPPMNSHNNIDELIGETDDADTAGRPSVPVPPVQVQRPPSRPLLNLFGSLVANALTSALNQGK